MSVNQIKSISNAAGELNKLETFDLGVFIDKEPGTQELCDFMLTLSLFCNDIKDTMLFNSLTIESRPNNVTNLTPEIGQFNGLIAYFQRYYVFKIKELAEILSQHQGVLLGNEFKKILMKLPSENRACWASIFDSLVADKKQSNLTKFGKMLAFIRHKLTAHYDTREISKGYRIFFEKNCNEPYASCGLNISQTRFYFADAAAQTYYYKKQFDLKNTDFDQDFINLMGKITSTFWLLIIRFINSRSSWKTPRADKVPKLEETKFD